MKFTIPRGMKDIEQDEFALREYIYKKIKAVLNSYGFRFVEPTALENLETLAAKAGPEIEKEIYAFKDKSGRKIALRFDLTVGLARMVANSNLPRPIKLACISNMWRYDRPQYARFRSFYQWDAEIFGASGVESDAEIIALTCDILEKFGLDYEIRISNRKVVEGFLLELGIDKKNLLDVLRTIDKSSKLSKKELMDEFKKYKLEQSQIDKILGLNEVRNDITELEKISKNELAKQGIDELKKLLSALSVLNKSDKCKIDIGVVRGIDYYTGIVYEAWIRDEERLGAVAGGGRYDELMALYGKPMPATGIAGGIERLLLSIKQKQKEINPKIQVIYVNKKLFEKAMKITQKLRKIVSTDIDLTKRNFSNQLKYANSRKVPFVLIIGERELKENKAKLKNMKTGDERQIVLDKLDIVKALVKK